LISKRESILITVFMCIALVSGFLAFSSLRIKLFVPVALISNVLIKVTLIYVIWGQILDNFISKEVISRRRKVGILMLRLLPLVMALIIIVYTYTGVVEILL
jgi:hypothetical protein